MRGWPGRDRDGGYGWISIALHWLTAAAILVLLFVGDSIAAGGEAGLKLHTSLAMSAWIVLALRIVWRLLEGHPKPAGKLGWSFAVGVVVHYLLLAALALMLVSGPVTAWSTGQAIHVFDLALPSPWPANPQLHALGRTLHAAGAFMLVWGVVLHVAGVLKHMFIDRDNLLDRIMTPPPGAPRADFAAPESLT